MPAKPRAVAYRPDGSEAAVMCADGQVLVVDARKGEVVAKLKTESRRLSANYWQGQCKVRYTKDGESLIARAYGVWVWDAKTKELRFSKKNANQHVTSIDVSKDGRRLAVAGGRNPVARVFDLASGAMVGDPIKHPDTVFAARFNPTGDQLLTACRDGQARLHDLETGELVLPGLTHDSNVRNARFTPCLLYTSPSPRDKRQSRMPSSA